MSLKLCVMGCGQFAKTFVKAIRSSKVPAVSEQIELFFASRNKDKAKAYCHKFGGEDYFGGYNEAAADPRVQAVYICTPHHLHLSHTVLAAQSSKHVLVEKPIARTLEEAEQMIAAAKGAGVKLMVAENYRFMPVVQKAKELIDMGAIGTLRLIQIQEEARYIVEGWRTKSEMMGGGVLIDGGIHSVDILLTLAGIPVEVYASRLPQALDSLEGEDGMILMARLDGGAAAFINHSWSVSKRRWGRWVTIAGTRGKVFFEPSKARITLESEEGRSTWKFPEDRSGMGHMIREFHDSIGEASTSLMSGEEGLKDLAVTLGAYKSAATGVPVTLK